MTTSLKKVLERAKKLGLPIAKTEFRKTKETPLPDPPFLIYIVPQEEERGADKKNFVISRQVALELYTDKAEDEGLENLIQKKVLFDIEYQKYKAIVQKEELVQTAYEFTIVEKIERR